MRFVVQTLSLLLLIAFFTACGTTSTKSDSADLLGADPASPEYINELLAQAESTDNIEQKLILMLKAAELLAQSGDTDWARIIIHTLPYNPDPLYSENTFITAKKALINSYIYNADGYSAMAYESLNSEALLATLPTLPQELTLAILELRAQLLLNMEQYPSSIEERIKISEILLSDSPEGEINQDAIWAALMEIPLQSLNKLAQLSQKREQKGWYTLASMSKNNQTNLRQQLQQVDQWIMEWPEHPASLRPPADLQILQQLLDEQPQNIAILLPLKGRLSDASNAIIDGFMAAYYEFKMSEQQSPNIKFYDTNNADINSLYDLAVIEGAQLIIGPLEKSHVEQLTLREELSIPTLVLNVINNATPTSNLYQFGLGVEDEAELAAHKAWRDGHRRALIITTNNTWGDRATQAFEFAWAGLGGELTKDYRFEDTNDYSKIISSALQLDQSHRRSQEIYGIVGHIEFEPRRRQDIDMIFLAAQASQARQVKPTLSFHYAGNLPVYATSHVYSGAPSPKLDQDMNGVKFSTLPWFFDTLASEKNTLNAYADSSPNLQPLYALGVDCFHLYPRLKQLEAVRKANFYGKTGTLNLNPNNQIHRKQIWAEFQNGRAQPLADTN